jgi:aryl-alcohol dehydrogenase-like predicted oxidoreductase
MKNGKFWTRRDFIAKPAVCLAASQLLTRSNFLFADTITSTPPATVTAALANHSKIITRTMGRTGISMPIVSMGATGIGAEGIVRRAFEAGVRHFDTAAEYQEHQQEAMIGSVIKQMGVRQQVVLATKVLTGDMRKNLTSAQAGQKMREIFEASLKSLQTDYVDILYMPQVDDIAELSLEGPLNTMVALKKEGKVRALGISTHQGEAVLNEVVRLGVHDVVLLVFNVSSGSDQGLLTAMERAHSKGVGIVAMKTSAGNMGGPGGGGGPRPSGGSAQGGGPGGPQQANGSGGPGQAGGQRPQGGPGGPGGGSGGPGGEPGGQQQSTGAARTALLKWVLHHESVTTLISAFASYDHIEQNVAVAYDLSYSEAERKVLADKKLVASLEFCHQCGQCRATCPYGAEIPTLMRAHMYALQYAPGTGFPRETLATIPAGRGLEACSNCASCKAACSRTVNIARKIAELQNWAVG